MSLPAEHYQAYLQRLDPELRSAIDGFISFFPGGYDLSTPEKIHQVRLLRSQRRRETNLTFRAPSVSVLNRLIPGFQRDPQVRIRIYRPKEGEAAGSAALLWIHGGAYVMGDLDGEDVVCARMAHNTGAAVISVEYRLAPEYHYPDPLHDCYAAYQWLLHAPDGLRLHPESLAVGGTSAGGGLAAALCLFLRDRGEALPQLQLLAAPALDNLSVDMLPDAQLEAPPITRNLLVNAWKWYLDSDTGCESAPNYAAASRAVDLSGLPPAYISVGSLDPLLGENLAYSRRLIAAGVPSEVHVYPRACHGFESFQPMAAISQRCLAEREAVLRDALSGRGCLLDGN